MKALIVYYSMTGNCELVAKELSDIMGADVLRIEPVKAYPTTGAKKFIWGGKSAVMGDTPKLKDYVFKGEDYDTVVIGFPVWASRVAPPIKTFVKENTEALKGKRIAAFACQGGNGAEKAFAKLCEQLGIKELAAQSILNEPKNQEMCITTKAMEEFAQQISH